MKDKMLESLDDSTTSPVYERRMTVRFDDRKIVQLRKMLDCVWPHSIRHRQYKEAARFQEKMSVFEGTSDRRPNMFKDFRSDDEIKAADLLGRRLC